MGYSQRRLLTRSSCRSRCRSSWPACGWPRSPPWRWRRSGAIVSYGGLGNLLLQAVGNQFKAQIFAASLLCVVLAVALDLVLVGAQRRAHPVDAPCSVTSSRTSTGRLELVRRRTASARFARPAAPADRHGAGRSRCWSGCRWRCTPGHRHRFGFLAVNVSNVGRAVPVFAALLVLSLGPVGSEQFGAYGRAGLATLIALVLFALPPIITNAYVGMHEVDRDIVEASRGMGMGEGKVFSSVELPLAMSVIMTGVRLALVQVWATATIAALVAGPGLGRIITRGFANHRTYEVVAGAILVAVGALLLEGLAVLAERYADPMRARPDGRARPRPSPLGRNCYPTPSSEVVRNHFVITECRSTGLVFCTRVPAGCPSDTRGSQPAGHRRWCITMRLSTLARPRSRRRPSCLATAACGGDSLESSGTTPARAAARTRAPWSSAARTSPRARSSRRSTSRSWRTRATPSRPSSSRPATSTCPS